MVALTPVRRYVPGGTWDLVEGRSLTSPAPDGTVIYYADTLCWAQRGNDDPEQWADLGFDPVVANAVCQHLSAMLVRARMEVADGPFLQLLEDDGTIPHGWVMLRALSWVDEYDVPVPVTSSAVSDDGLSPASIVPAAPVGQGVV